MLLPLEMGLKVQKNNVENTVYSSHVGCLALKGQWDLFWSKCNLFGFGLNFLCLPRDPLPISKLIKTFSYYWKKVYLNEVCEISYNSSFISLYKEQWIQSEKCFLQKNKHFKKLQGITGFVASI